MDARSKEPMAASYGDLASAAVRDGAQWRTISGGGNVTINRPQFRQRAGATGGALAAAAALPACHTVFPVGYQSKQNLLDKPAAQSEVDPTAIVMMETRSFAHWLGWLGSHRGYLANGASLYGKYFR